MIDTSNMFYFVLHGLIILWQPPRVNTIINFQWQDMPSGSRIPYKS